MIRVEVCVNSDSVEPVRQAVAAAYLGGAATVELCAAMHLHGLTPQPDQIKAAREAFRSRPGLMVMIRPRAGDFSYSPAELELMHHQLAIAAEAGADGVVLGVLRPKDNRLAIAEMARLLEAGRAFGLRVTCHRAFDATPDPLDTLSHLIELGANRLLTGGVPWATPGGAGDGLARLAEIINQAQGKIEVVLGGGINPVNVADILRQLPLNDGNVSVHAYSGVHENGQTTIKQVQSLVAAANFQANCEIDYS